MITILISIAFFILLIFLISAYNGMVKRRNRVEKSFSSIDVFLKKRFDLIPNLVESVKSIMNHERGLLEGITALRSQVSNLSGNSKERLQVEGELSKALHKLNFSFENYPEIKSDKNMLALQASLNNIEEQLSASRRVYNQSVESHNNGIETFPNNMLAGMFGFSRKESFQTLEVEKTNPQVGVLFKDS